MLPRKGSIPQQGASSPWRGSVSEDELSVATEPQEDGESSAGGPLMLALSI